MENIELCFEYDGAKYASLYDGEDNVVIVKVQNTENGVEFQEIDDEELYSKLITEYKSYDLEEDEIYE